MEEAIGDLIFLGVFSLFGLAGVSLLRPVLKSRRFKPVTVTITRSEATPVDDGMYKLDLKFTYRIEGVEYSEGRYSDRICESASTSYLALSRAYPVGSTHQAWYDPNDHATAVLNRADNLGVGISLLIIGIAPWLIWAWHLIDSNS
jgi:hypothetical protein